ncbi:prenyltransferase/squalene oxidase repeat-containing protein [Asanoa sp. WMMD1127]|uniref:prenyltransferase/squalene oxidase repeat-containing protein n=1 Tax=Asanoa sp. WMMD1127 TaxID=3016107 RepID=UPI0024160C1B|nr:prenyltransferase/squalene oxidase repeat-containing protein [Asanoa sp. WMMD1127]MDG4820873.1 prenyltransferase/squalene oxidase repeat-containing protein [Asanoa sp. WMMD1127]
MLDGDPAVRWRVLRDLTGAGEPEVTRERARVATEGWGARLLAEQSPDGTWGGGVYTPKWTSTTYTLLRLLWLGLVPGHPAALRGCARLWEWQDRRRVAETCVVSMFVRVSCAFGHRTGEVDEAIAFLLDQQQDDGGWNCAARGDRAKHSSFHTSIMALEALEAAGGPDAVAAERGREFFLAHRLYRSHRTGEVAVRGSVRFPAFPEWHFDVLRGLEYFARTGARDDRLADAVDVVARARRKDGRWPTYSAYPGKQWFQAEPPGASRLNTARALSVLAWWDSGRR